MFSTAEDEEVAPSLEEGVECVVALSDIVYIVGGALECVVGEVGESCSDRACC
jgi:hypothetical protein